MSEFVSIVVGEIVGAEPFNFRQEGLGSSPLIDNIVPVPKLKSQKGAGGFDNNFPFHSESAWHRLRPDYLVLTGLRGDPNAQTLLFSAQSLSLPESPVTSMPRPGTFRLAAPQLYKQMEARGMPMGTDQYSYQDPIYDDRNGNYVLNVNFNGTDCSSELSALWLNAFEKFIEKHAYSAVLRSDMAIIINNSRTCHTRSGYDPVFNGQQRWFQRTYFKTDLWSTAYKPRRDSDTARSLIARGWLTSDLDLTKTFSSFVKDNEDLSLLDSDTQQLVTEAYKFGPSSGSRLV